MNVKRVTFNESLDSEGAPPWSYWCRWAGFGLALLGAVGTIVIISFSSKDAFGWNALAAFSFAVTAFGVGLASLIYERQGSESEVDKVAHEAVLDEIRKISTTAATSARSAHINTDEIIDLLNKSREERMGSKLSAEREAQVVNAVRELDPGVAYHVLWVDDRKESIELERQALAGAGVAIAWVPNTSRALELLAGNTCNLVITDMGRKEGPLEGYVLLDAMRDSDDGTPLLVYSGSRRPEHVQKVLDHGGQGATNDPAELLELAIKHLQHL